MGIIEAVAIYGAVVATLTLVWHSISVYRDRTSAKLNITGIIEELGDKIIEKQITVTVINTGRRPITLNSAGFKLSNGYNLCPNFARHGFPYKLNEGENYQLFFDWDDIKEGLRKHQGKTISYAWVGDQTGHFYTAKLPEEIEEALYRSL